MHGDDGTARVTTTVGHGCRGRGAIVRRTSRLIHRTESWKGRQSARGRWKTCDRGRCFDSRRCRDFVTLLIAGHCQKDISRGWDVYLELTGPPK